jgi:hypothetical protein
VEALRAQYPLKVKSFDVERDKDYALFKRMEAIHGRTRFKAPLVMIGDEILIGNEEIISKLESLIQDQIRRGGAPLPYLGPDYSSAGEIVRGFLCGCSDRGKSTTGAHTWLSSGPTPRIQSISRLVALHSFP